MLSRCFISRSCTKALLRQSCGQTTQTRGLAAAASGSFQYETGSESGIKYASRDLPGPTTTLTLVAKAGTRYQTQPGYSDALEKFAYKSTTKRSAMRIVREVELLGGELSAYHSRENLVLRAKFLREDLPYFAELLAEVISKTRYTPHELSEEVMRVMKLGQKSLLANPSHMAINSAHGLAFHRGLGTPLYPTSSTTFSKYLDAEEIYDFARSAYSKSNIAVVANGTSQSDLSKWVREFFEDTNTDGKKLQSPATKYYGGEERIAHDKGNVMVLAFPGSSSFTSGSSYKPELAVLASLLGGQSSIKWTPGFSLLAKAASQHQHAHVSTQNHGYTDGGLLVVTLTGNASHIAKASQSVVETLKKIASGDVSGEDIKKATALAKFQALETGQDINAGLEATGSGLISGGKAYQIDEIGQAIEKVGEDKVKAAAKSLLDTKATVSTIGDLFALPYAEDIGLKKFHPRSILHFMVRDIPGFFYDAERKKYFKIQPNHAGPGQQHSRQEIEQRESANKRRKTTHEYLTRQERETVSRSKLLTHPLLGRFSLRSKLGRAAGCGLNPDPNEDRAAYYAASLSSSTMYDARMSVDKFVVDEKTGAIILAHSSLGDGNDTLHCVRPARPGHYCGIPHVFEAMSSTFADMGISTQWQKLLYVSCGSHGTRTVLLDIPKIKDDPHSTIVNQVWDFSDEIAWQVATSPTGEAFAVAASNGLNQYTMLQSHITLTTWTDSSEYMAVAFGRDNRTTMAGKRSGIVKFFDERTQDFVTRLRHKDAVSKIRMIDDNRVVVRGLEKMSMYDLRYTKAPAKKQKNRKTATTPYRLFPWENNSFNFDSGFDYSPELGIIATVSSQTLPSHRLMVTPRMVRQEIHLFSVRTGKKLRSLHLSNHDNNYSQATCIRFSRIRSTFAPESDLRAKDNEPLSLLASAGGWITEWSGQGVEESGDGEEE